MLALLAAVYTAAQTKKQTTQESVPPHKQIVEKVDVTNIEVRVRVFHQGKPVRGLKKSNFKILLKKKEVPINGFFENRKAIVPPSSPSHSEAPPPRLFLLIFNVCDYNVDFSKVLDTLFTRIFKPGDRLMVLSNSFFFDDRVIKDPVKEKRKLEQMLQMETQGTRGRIKVFEQRLLNMRRSFLSRIRGAGTMNRYSAEMTRDEFVATYSQLLKEYKYFYLNVNTAQYAQLAGYLEEQEVEKWVLSFYQVGRFFKPKAQSEFIKAVVGDSFGKGASRYDEMHKALEANGDLIQEDLGKLFVNSGATFHTMLLQDTTFIRNDLSDDLAYVPIGSDSHDLLKEIAEKTGGTFLSSNNADKFYSKVTGREDIFYVLTYAPPKGKAAKKGEINIVLNTPDQSNTKEWRITYDDQDRSKSFRRLIKKSKPTVPQIKIEQVELKGRFLSVVVANFQLEPPKNPKADPDTLKLPLRLQVLNRDMRSMYDGVEVFKQRRKDLQTARVKLEMVLPTLPPGVYDFFVYVGDPATLKRDLAVKQITIPASAAQK
jgi:hypothetical protein